ncbi:HotDog domain-containing protein [Leptodontidium sp. 2 PMI_412]|nr:thioesterase family protein-like protein [Leptodontidium sp. MPI-SDFR-AT-0119]KAH9217266.1 HotDog domain-containing protein [Leptodontidium sp. 2 PMI_412]
MAEDAAASRAKAMKGVEAIFERYLLIAKSTDFTGFDRHIMENVKLIDASAEGTVTFEFYIDERYSNVNGVMHGGAAGVIFDMCTTTALGPLAKPGFWDFLGGVTRTLNISYLRAIPVGTTVRIHSVVMQVGKTMAMIRGTMTTQDGKTILCTCEHHKVGVPSQPAHLKHRVPWDELWEKDAAVGENKKEGAKL